MKLNRIILMAEKQIKRSRKRVITRRDELPVNKLVTAKLLPKLKSKQQPKTTIPKKPGIPPSDIRLGNLNASEERRQYKPLAIGIEKAVFKHIANHQLSSSKRVVQRMLRMHALHEKHLQNLQSSEQGFNLDGTGAGAIRVVVILLTFRGIVNE